MLDLIVHTSDSDAGDQSCCDLDASVNDILLFLLLPIKRSVLPINRHETVGKVSTLERCETKIYLARSNRKSVDFYTNSGSINYSVSMKFYSIAPTCTQICFSKHQDFRNAYFIFIDK